MPGGQNVGKQDNPLKAKSFNKLKWLGLNGKMPVWESKWPS
jgi:hypothetical protein